MNGEIQMLQKWMCVCLRYFLITVIQYQNLEFEGTEVYEESQFHSIVTWLLRRTAWQRGLAEEKLLLS